MNRLFLIAVNEWRYWLRSKLILGATCLFILLVVVTSATTALKIQEQHHSRTQHQNEAEDIFLNQPDRHPHRMVHYGHYVYRTPPPLAIFDPGVNSVTGEAIFLEGHRQNSATFTELGASADLGGMSTLTPALLYQFFAPLLIVLIGYGVVVREREDGVLSQILAQGVGGRTIVMGKALAIISFVVLMLVPMLVSSVISMIMGESVVALFYLFICYFVYLVIWAALTVFISASIAKRSTILAMLIAAWLGTTLVIPSLAVNFATNAFPIAGKIETDLEMLAAMHKLGDGHNAKDPAFKTMLDDLMKEHGVDRVDDLPINVRGFVSMRSEEKQTELLNRYADARMEEESKQSNELDSYAWFSPTQALSKASRTISGTDLRHYHLFLEEAEALRFSFVQGLNKAHVEELSYDDDMNRNKDEASWAKARIDASNWQVLESFEFTTLNAAERIQNTLASAQKLLVWLLLSFIALLFAGGRLRP